MKKKMRILGICMAGLFILSGVFFTSCDKDDDNGDDNNGKTDPSTIASESLVAHFAFENNGNEEESGIAPAESNGVTYVEGKRGQAYQGSANAYFLYDLPAGNPLRDLKAFTVAMWFYGKPAINGEPPVPGIIQISGSADPIWGNLMLTQDRMDEVVDSLNIKMVFHKEGIAWSNQFVGFSNAAFIENRWMHIAFSYDSGNSEYMVYVNGAPLDLGEGITKRWAAGEDVTPRPPLGELSFEGASQFAIGGWIQKIKGAATDEWMGYFGGKMDELRIYDKGLSDTEVKNLYDAEVTQLNE